jgi:hypothetical protein
VIVAYERKPGLADIAPRRSTYEPRAEVRRRSDGRGRKFRVIEGGKK